MIRGSVHVSPRVNDGEVSDLFATPMLFSIYTITSLKLLRNCY